MGQTHLKLVRPSNVLSTVPPGRKPNADLRAREYLTEKEVERLIRAAKGNRWGHRDATMVLTTFRHGLRAKEACALRWDQVDFNGGKLHVARAKNGSASVHPLTGAEMRALRQLKRESPESPFVFVSERGSPLTPVVSTS